VTAAGAAADPELDRRYMAAALRLGRRELGLTSPNPAVGALVVDTRGEGPRIIGRGATRPPGGPHAERLALAQAGEAARGATLYVSLEPCSHYGRTPPCVDAILAAGVRRVVTPFEDPNPLVCGQGHAALRDGGVEVVTGILAEEARRAHAGHLRAIAEALPHVVLKLAVSRDGRIGGPGRTPRAISGEESLALAHMLRVEADAILIGIGTALADDPQLTARLPGLEKRSPIRVVLDRSLRLPLDGCLARTAAATPLWVMTGENAPADRRGPLEAAGAAVLDVPLSPEGLDLEAVLRLLCARGARYVLVEGGARVAASLVRSGLATQIVLVHAPVEIGAGGVDALEGLPLGAIDRAFPYALVEERRMGRDRVRVYWRK